jgi:energy-coupling factor transporter ATP-binding protein EcfA2
MKELFLLRGVPGSGKSTLAKSLGGVHYEADMFFIEGGQYKFNPKNLPAAHEWCRQVVEESMADWNGSAPSPRIVVSNTFTKEWEMEAYFELAKKWGYTVFSLVVENRHGGVNEHGVPEDKVQAMRDRFEFKL